MIGVFDSGHGGLTVLRALVAGLDRQSFVYFGDHARAPYGTRDPREIYEMTRNAVAVLFEQGCGLVVLACNTAAAVALRRLQKEWLPSCYPDRRVLGVLVPTVEAITRVPWSVDALSGDAPLPRLDGLTVGLFATPRTVESGAYVHEVAKRAPGVQVVQQSCPELAGLIEAGASDTTLDEAVSCYVGMLLDRSPKPLDCVVLGCTHYPLVADLFRRHLPPGVDVLSQPHLVAESLRQYLLRHPEFGKDGDASLRFLTSGETGLVSDLGTRFFGRTIRFASLSHPDIEPVGHSLVLSG